MQALFYLEACLFALLPCSVADAVIATLPAGLTKLLFYVTFSVYPL